MPEQFVDLDARDADEVLALNRAAVPAVGDVDRERLLDLFAWSSLAVGLRDDDRLVGVVLCMGPGSSYDSVNYRFFDQRYDDFVYVDRVVVAADARSRGHGGRLYDEVVTRSPGVALMTAEVNLVPPNEGSMRFHLARGFRRVGAMENADGSHRVQFLAADLG